MFTYMVWLKEVGSTQDVLKEGDFPYGTVVVADTQKRGKGRKGRRWESQEGGLYFSFVLSAKNFRDTLQIPLLLGLSVSEALGTLGFDTLIKWPNDVYLEGKKVSGALVERTGDRIVSGIGINVNQTSFPHDIRDTAVSLRMVAGREFSVVEVLSLVLGRLRENLTLYARTGFEPFRERIENVLAFKGEEVVVLSEEPLAGILVGINGAGFLILETQRGRREVTSGDLTLRPRV
jgi:BirA family biotin operon repressor/biotin-[acetyl-CoA-carboxylase] ligase